MDRKQLILIAAVCGGVILLGTLLPWVSTSAPLGMSVTVAGTGTGLGPWVLILGLLGGAAALLIHLGKVGQFVKLTELQHLYVAAGAFGLATLFLLIQFMQSYYQTQTVMGQSYGSSRGIGLWIALLGALGGEAASLMLVKNAMAGATPPASPPKA
jgi:hypothetical protein